MHKGERLFLAAAIMSIMQTNLIHASAQEISPSPTTIPATPTPYRRPGQDVGPHVLTDHDYTIRTQKFCGGETNNPESGRFGRIGLEVEHVPTTAQPPVLVIWDMATNPAGEIRIPTTRESRGKMSASIDVDLGTYSIFADNGSGAITQLWDERKFICPSYAYDPTAE